MKDEGGRMKDERCNDFPFIIFHLPFFISAAFVALVLPSAV